MLLRRAASMEAHIALRGSKIEAFQAVAGALTENIDFSPTADAGSVYDRCERLQRNSDAEDHRDTLASGDFPNSRTQRLPLDDMY